MQRRRPRLESTSRAKTAPQRRESETCTAWTSFQTIFSPPRLWQATALQTSNYLWVAMATGTRLFHEAIVNWSENQIAQRWFEPRSLQEEALRQNAPTLITLMRQSTIIILLMPLLSFLPTTAAENRFTITVVVKIMAISHG